MPTDCGRIELCPLVDLGIRMVETGPDLKWMAGDHVSMHGSLALYLVRPGKVGQDEALEAELEGEIQNGWELGIVERFATRVGDRRNTQILGFAQGGPCLLQGDESEGVVPWRGFGIARIAGEVAAGAREDP